MWKELLIQLKYEIIPNIIVNWLLKDDTNKFVWKFTTESVVIDKKERSKVEKDYVRIYIYKS